MRASPSKLEYLEVEAEHPHLSLDYPLTKIGRAAMFASIAKSPPVTAPPFLVLMLRMTASSAMEISIWMVTN